jgi:hypothetical protein
LGRTKARMALQQAAAAEVVRLHKRRERRRAFVIFGAGGLVLLALIAAAAVVLVGAQQQRVTVQNSATKPIVGVQTFPKLTRNHTATPGPYPQNPPVGGDHSPTWVNCGIYSQDVNSSRAVHSLEHGAVWIAYEPTLPADQVRVLTAQAAGNRFEILAPRVGLPSPIVATAWGVQLKLSTAADPRLAVFLRKYQQGPQTPEPGASCTGGSNG